MRTSKILLRGVAAFVKSCEFAARSYFFEPPNIRIFVKKRAMNVLVIDNKSYVVIPEKNYQALQKKAALKTRPEKILSVEEARAYSKKLIRKWAAGK
ncbi:MAG: hypothetical protein V4649_06490 [Bacteroidota bacterium]